MADCFEGTWSRRGLKWMVLCQWMFSPFSNFKQSLRVIVKPFDKCKEDERRRERSEDDALVSYGKVIFVLWWWRGSRSVPSWFPRSIPLEQPCLTPRQNVLQKMGDSSATGRGQFRQWFFSSFEKQRKLTLCETWAALNLEFWLEVLFGNLKVETVVCRLLKGWNPYLPWNLSSEPFTRIIHLRP